jgi:hypothetical protein
MYRLKLPKLAPVVSISFLIVVGGANGTVYYSREEAIELAFGSNSGAQVENLPIFLTDEQVDEVEKTAQVKVDSNLFTFYVGKRQGSILGYAAIDSNVVRTQQETMLIVLSPSGELVRVEILAFHEPPEYQPPARWFDKTYRRPLDDLNLNHGVDGISGATISSRAALSSIRKTMAIYRIALQDGAK